MLIKQNIESYRDILRRKYRESVKREKQYPGTLSQEINQLRTDLISVIISEYPDWVFLGEKISVNGSLEKKYDQSRMDFVRILVDDFERNPLLCLNFNYLPETFYIHMPPKVYF